MKRNKIVILLSINIKIKYFILDSFVRATCVLNGSAYSSFTSILLMFVSKLCVNRTLSTRLHSNWKR